ncbi:MAG TPA: DUF6350 family protein [Mycobacteriales bacterium]|nr:DUF6350 family protein [Mycobacteriales bacterium]
MTDLDVRPEAAAEPAPAPPRPIPARSLRSAIVMAAGVAVAGLVIIAALVLIAWGAEKRSTASPVSAVRAAGAAWLFAQHSPLGTDAGTIGLVPLGLLALPLALLVWAGVQVGRDIAPCSGPDAARSALAMAATYGVVAFLVHLAVANGPARIGALAAVLPAVGLAFLGTGAGIVHGAGFRDVLLRRLPAWIPVCCRAAGLALAVLLAASAVLVGAALATDGGRVVALTDNLAVGVVGGVLLLVLSVLLAPNAIVCAAAYAVGPGFAVGSGTSVTVHGSSLGPVPAYPLLAALPEGSHPSPLSWAVLAAPVLGGVLAGMLLVRVRPPQSWRLVLLPGLVTGLLAGAAVGLLALAAGGPLGAGRMAAIGPSAWQVGGAYAVEIAVLSTVTAACCGWREIREARIERELAELRAPVVVQPSGETDAAEPSGEPEPSGEAEAPGDREEPDEPGQTEAAEDNEEAGLDEADEDAAAEETEDSDEDEDGDADAQDDDAEDEPEEAGPEESG